VPLHQLVVIPLNDISWQDPADKPLPHGVKAIKDLSMAQSLELRACYAGNGQLVAPKVSCTCSITLGAKHGCRQSHNHLSQHGCTRCATVPKLVQQHWDMVSGPGAFMLTNMCRADPVTVAAISDVKERRSLLTFALGLAETSTLPRPTVSTLQLRCSSCPCPQGHPQSMAHHIVTCAFCHWLDVAIAVGVMQVK
jgi:hypothetical protein